MTREEVVRMIEQIDQKILYEDDTYILVENVFYGENIIFEFDDDKLILIGS